MSLTQCPGCHELSFVDSESCPTCARAFQSGQLRNIANAEDRAFKKRAGVVFITLLMISLAVTLVVILQGYMSGTWAAQS